MLNIKMAVIGVLLLAAAPADAQTIYKCKAADGTNVYSQQPCGAHAHKVKLAPERKLSAEEQAHVDAQRKRFAEEDRVHALDRREQECFHDMTAWRLDASDRRIADYRNQIARLELRIARAANNLAGATWESGMRDQIGSINESIAVEQTTQTQTLANARTVCSARRAAWEAKNRAASKTP